MEMKRLGLERMYFTALALKFKGISDADDKALAGQTEAMQKRYKVNVDWFDSPR